MGAWNATPGGELLHSICRSRSANHLYLGVSIGGIFESLDGGRNWQPLNRGIEADFLPDAALNSVTIRIFVVQHPLQPDRFVFIKITAAFIAWIVPTRVQRIGKAMRKKSAILAFHRAASRGSRYRRGPWMSPCGRVHRSTASLPCMSPAMAAKAGSDKTKVCPSRRRGSPCTSRMCADTTSDRNLFGNTRAKCGRVPTRANPGNALADICRQIFAIYACGLNNVLHRKNRQPVTLVRNGAASVNAKGASVTEVLADLDRRSPVCAL